MNFLNTIISSVIGGITGSILTNFFNNKKQEKEFINRVLFFNNNCLQEILIAMEHPESNLNQSNPNPYTPNGFLENRCKEYRIEKENLKKEYYKTSEKIIKQIEKFNEKFDYIASFNMSKLITYGIYEIEIKNKYNEMQKINDALKKDFKL